VNSFLAHLDSVLADCASQPETAVTRMSKVRVRKSTAIDKSKFLQTCWDKILRTDHALPSELFAVKTVDICKHAPPAKERKPLTLAETPPGKPMSKFAEEALLRARRGNGAHIRELWRKHLAPVTGGWTKLGRTVQLQSRNLTTAERRFLLKICDVFIPDLIAVTGYNTPTLPGAGGEDYIRHEDRRRGYCGIDPFGIPLPSPERPDGVMSFRGLPHAPFKPTTEKGFAKRLKLTDAKAAMEAMRIESSGLAWALIEICVKGRSRKDVLEQRPDLDRDTVIATCARLRKRVRSKELANPSNTNKIVSELVYR
jgi:hypothetical protein